MEDSMKDTVHHIRHIQKKVIQEMRKKNLDKSVNQSSNLNTQRFGNGKNGFKTVT